MRISTEHGNHKSRPKEGAMREPVPTPCFLIYSSIGSERRFTYLSAEQKKGELIFEKHDIAFVNPLDNPDADILACIGLMDRHVFAFH